MERDLKHLTLLVKGYVQGVGFRYFIRNIASALNINGTVKNLSNGDVEIDVEGEEHQLEEFTERIQTEHDYAHISNIEVKQEELKFFKDFKIIH